MNNIEINGYNLGKKIGDSDLCSIYRAMQVSLERTVALKVLRPEHEANPTMVAKFKLQANAVNNLRHANIPQIFHSDESHGHHYFSREFIDGKHIGKRVRKRHGMAESDALLTIENIALALEHAWQASELVHANLKPRNVLVDNSGAVKLVDFSGLTASSSTTLRQALSDVQIGHPAYAAPEMAELKNEIDFRSDMYSLGALLYQFLTGREPFRNHSDTKPGRTHHSDFLAHPQDLRLKCSEPTSILLQKLMIKDPDGRYSSWEELLADISFARSNRVPDTGVLKSQISAVKNPNTRLKAKKRDLQTLGHRIAETIIYILLGIFVAVNIYLFILLSSN